MDAPASSVPVQNAPVAAEAAAPPSAQSAPSPVQTTPAVQTLPVQIAPAPVQAASRVSIPMAVGIVLAVVLAVVTAVWLTKRVDEDSIDSNLLYGLAHVVPSTRCIPVPVQDIINGTTRYGTVDLAVVRASLKHHMRYGVGHGGLQAISAAHFERQNLCMALVNLINGPHDKPNVVEMYNMRIMFVKPKARRVSALERSIFCKEPIRRERFAVVDVEYWDRNGEYTIGSLDGLSALHVQQVYEVERAVTSCSDSNVEVTLNRMQRDIVEMNENMVAYNINPEIAAGQTRRALPQ